MNQLADLHTHSTASDGQYSPAQVVQRAGQAGVEVLALTDHDTIDGVEEAVQAGKTLGMTVWGPKRPGISTFWALPCPGTAPRWPGCAGSCWTGGTSGNTGLWTF